MPRPLLLVDAPSLYFRAYFGVPESVATAPDGSPVNAVRGFLDMLATLVRTRRPDRLVCALDADWRPAWRVALIPSYKAHRLAQPAARPSTQPAARRPAAPAGVEPAGPPRVTAATGPAAAVDDEEIPDRLVPQVPVILDVLAAFGIPALGAPGYEADDVLGTLASREPGPVEVVSGDRDLFQLVDDEVPIRLLYCGRGVAKLEVFDDEAVRRRYGVPAAGYADFAALRGDPSDGLPGVPGVGEKTAARLIDRYGNLAGVLAAVADSGAGFAPGLRTKLVAAADYLAVAPKVVEVARDAPMPGFDTDLPHVPADPDRLLELAQRWNLAGAIRRLVDAVAAAHEPAAR